MEAVQFLPSLGPTAYNPARPAMLDLEELKGLGLVLVFAGFLIGVARQFWISFSSIEEEKEEEGKKQS